jgi:hypothetical protein
LLHNGRQTIGWAFTWLETKQMMKRDGGIFFENVHNFAFVVVLLFSIDQLEMCAGHRCLCVAFGVLLSRRPAIFWRSCCHRVFYQDGVLQHTAAIGTRAHVLIVVVD